jgi:hypothetical protein
MNGAELDCAETCDERAYREPGGVVLCVQLPEDGTRPADARVQP